MASRALLRAVAAPWVLGTARATAGGGARRALGGAAHDHHHAPDMPPFARLRPPTQKLPEEVELVWDDTVAPETCIDFDAPHVETSEVLLAFFGAFAFFGGLYGLVALSDPVGSNPVAVRATVIPEATLLRIRGIVVNEEHGEEEEEEEEEE